VFLIFVTVYLFIIFIIERRLKEAKKPKETPVVQPGIFITFNVKILKFSIILIFILFFLYIFIYLNSLN